MLTEQRKKELNKQVIYSVIKFLEHNYDDGIWLMKDKEEIDYYNDVIYPELIDKIKYIQKHTGMKVGW